MSEDGEEDGTGPDQPPGRSEATTGDDRSDAADPFEALPRPDGEDPFERLDGEGVLGEGTPATESDPFESVDVATGVSEAPWEDLVSAEGATASPVDRVDPTTVGETVVPKRRYCQDCEHFTDPPEVACTHPDGEILEVVDVDRFRVRNCPVVGFRRNHPAYDGPGVGADD
jgi:hypothetical protein